MSSLTNEPTNTQPATRSRKFKLRVIALGVVVAVAAIAMAVFAFRSRDDFSRFQGEWQLAVPTGARENQPTARRVQHVTIRIDGDRWAYCVGEKEMQKYALTLRPEANPKEIDLVQLDANGNPTAFVQRGIYTIDGDWAKIVTSSGEEERPAKFDDPDGPPGIVLERVR